MPSKQRKCSLKKKFRYVKNADKCKEKAQINYRQTATAVISRSTARRTEDKTTRRKKMPAQNVDLSYKQRNRQLAKVNTTRRLKGDPSYKHKNHLAVKRRLEQDQSYRVKNRLAATANKKRRLEADPSYKEQHQELSRVHTQRRLEEDPSYRDRNKHTAKINSQRRWNTNSSYREKKRASARISATCKWHADKAAGVTTNCKRDSQGQTGIRQYHKTLVPCGYTAIWDVTSSSTRQATETAYQAGNTI